MVWKWLNELRAVSAIVFFILVIHSTSTTDVECSVNSECTDRDNNSMCDISAGLCVCLHKLYRDIPHESPIKCAVGRAFGEECRSTKECLRVDQFSHCDQGSCRCNIGYNPMRKTTVTTNDSHNHSRCMLDPLFYHSDHAHLTFFKVSPVPLLVICIILVYLGYQRGAKLPQRRGSSTSNRRIVPMWRGVTFHQDTPPRSSTSLPTSAGSNSSSSQNGQTVVNMTDLGYRRESSSVTADRDSRRSRGSAHSQRELNGRQERNALPSENRRESRRDSAMSPPPPYAQEEAPPSYEDAIKAATAASDHDNDVAKAATRPISGQDVIVDVTSESVGEANAPRSKANDRPTDL